MYNRLIPFLDKNKVFYQNQNFYALITLVDNITKSLDNGDIVIGVSLDLKRHLI